MIKPTIGRVVWVRNRYGNASHGQPEAALISYVWNDQLIENFDAAVGQRVSREDAKRTVWLLLAYALRDQLYVAEQPRVDER